MKAREARSRDHARSRRSFPAVRQEITTKRKLVGSGCWRCWCFTGVVMQTWCAEAIVGVLTAGAMLAV